MTAQAWADKSCALWLDRRVKTTALRKAGSSVDSRKPTFALVGQADPGHCVRANCANEKNEATGGQADLSAAILLGRS